MRHVYLPASVLTHLQTQINDCVYSSGVKFPRVFLHASHSAGGLNVPNLTDYREAFLVRLANRALYHQDLGWVRLLNWAARQSYVALLPIAP